MKRYQAHIKDLTHKETIEQNNPINPFKTCYIFYCFFHLIKTQGCIIYTDVKQKKKKNQEKYIQTIVFYTECIGDNYWLPVPTDEIL